jgi:hypothetical protein
MNRREKKRMRGLRGSSTALPGDGESRTHHAQQVVTASGISSDILKSKENQSEHGVR